MARVGISITKSITFRGVAQEFSNTYYYEGPALPGETVAETMIDFLVTEEKQIHATTVSFKRGRCWSAGGTNQTNQMIKDKALTGTGSATANSFLDRERAVLVRFRAGNDTKGRPVYLRKWWHLDVAAIGGSGISNPQAQNVDQLVSAQRATIVGWGDDIKQMTPTGGAGTYNLCSKNGRLIDGATIAHPYLEHHQLGDMWRT